MRRIQKKKFDISFVMGFPKKKKKFSSSRVRPLNFDKDTHSCTILSSSKFNKKYLKVQIVNKTPLNVQTSNNKNINSSFMTNNKCEENEHKL